MRLVPLSREIKKFQEAREHAAAGRAARLRWLLIAGIFVLTVALTSPFIFYRPPALPEGAQQTPGELVAWTDFRVELGATVREWEDRRERTHRRVWRYDGQAGPGARNHLRNILETAEALNPAEDSPAAMLSALRLQDARLLLTEDTVAEFVAVASDPHFREAMHRTVRDAYDQYFIADRPAQLTKDLDTGVAQIELQDASMPARDTRGAFVLPADFDWYHWRPVVQRRLDDLGSAGTLTSETVPRHVERLLGAVVRPNFIFDEAATNAARETFVRGNLTTLFTRGQTLLSPETAGREISAEQASILAAHRDAVIHAHRKRLLGHVGFVALAFLILGFYVRKLSGDEVDSLQRLYLIPLPVLLALAVEFFVIVLADGRTDPVGYLFPAGAIGMLGVLLLDVRIALLLVTWGCLLFGLQVNLGWEYVIVALFGGYTAVAAIYSIRKRYEVFVASIFVGVVNAAVILLLGFIRDAADMPFTAAGLGLAAGIGTFLVLAVLPVVERFGIITDMQLLELSGLHNPLLRHMEEVAPGTWQHTLNVSKLAEAAATEIGVNYLLVRAGCYYHDIGKTRKPEYFSENQITKEEKMLHQRLKPQMSTFVIKNHVKEGVEMARREGLPARIIDFISQHHGTSVIVYFYHKALEAQARGEEKGMVRIEDYRYPGPKPQTIEAAIVMLADSVEATATAKLSGRAVREDDIQQVVRTTILEKFNDGQFDECNLTLRDLNIIREVFVKVLKSRFHTRIDYPKRPDAPKHQKPKTKDGAVEKLRESIDQPATESETARA